MAAVAAAGVGAANPAAAPSLWLKGKEDSIGIKILAAIPVIGLIFEGLAQGDINAQLQHIAKNPNKTPADEQRAIKLLKTSVQYNAIGIARDVVLLAGVIALFVLNIFGVIALVSACLAVAAQIAFHSWNIHMKRQAIALIQQNGLT